jgi:uncharacterized protein (UPF0335 family)
MENEMRKQIDKVKSFGKFLNENNGVVMNKVDSFKTELKELLAKYNVEIYADSKGEGFTSEVVVDMDNKEIMRVLDTLSQWDIK